MRPTPQPPIRAAKRARAAGLVRAIFRNVGSLAGAGGFVIGIASCVGTIGDGLGGAGAATAGDAGTSAAAMNLLPARVRRLSNGEFDATTHALLGTSQTFASMLPVDVRQGSFNAGGFPAAGFTRNAAAVFDAVATPQVESAADALAKEAVTKVTTLAPCASGTDQTTCAKSFISSFGAKAYRRSLTTDEESGLLTVYQTGAKDQTYTDGIELVVTTILQSAGFLYVTELGATPSNGVVKLTSNEVASSLSYFLTGGPPDATLQAAAAADALQDPKAVGTQASRLLQQSMGQLATFVEQWLGIDTPPGTSTGTMVSGTEMTAESTAFIDDVMTNGDGSLQTLLSSPSSFVDGPLASLYGVTAPGGGMSTTFGKVSNPQRPGLLNQASFLSTYAHSSFSAPIKRGHLVRTQMLCDAIPPPSPSLMVNVTPPLPTTAQTTRQADVEHMTSPACAACHQLMDPIGWGFENFDGNGAYRTMEAGMMVDDSGELNQAAELTGPFNHDAALIAKLSTSKSVEQCYMKRFADFAAASTDPNLETSFRWRSGTRRPPPSRRTCRSSSSRSSSPTCSSRGPRNELRDVSANVPEGARRHVRHDALRSPARAVGPRQPAERAAAALRRDPPRARNARRVLAPAAGLRHQRDEPVAATARRRGDVRHELQEQHDPHDLMASRTWLPTSRAAAATRRSPASGRGASTPRPDRSASRSRRTWG